MKNRSPIAVFFLSLITLGIYQLVWYVKTKGEMNGRGANIPTAWLIIIPIVNIYWLWKYSEGVGKVTNGAISGVLAFVLLWLLGVIGSAIVQDAFNKVPAGSVADSGNGMNAPIAPAVPGFGGDTTVATTSATPELSAQQNENSDTGPSNPVQG